MGMDIRLPNINASTEEGQLMQIKSYLYQFAEQLKYAISTLEDGGATSGEADRQAISASPAETATPGSTFNSIKSLIIKSADIVNAYYEEINRRLEGEYVSQSEFGTYSEQTSQTISENSTAIEQVFNNIQQITSALEEVKHTLIEVNAYMKSGLLAYDDNGVPIYGLEVGQRNIVDGEEIFNKYARFTANRLSFYDQNDTEVAYMSDYKFYITNGEITGTLKLGAFLIDTRTGFKLKYEGRGE